MLDFSMNINSLQSTQSLSGIIKKEIGIIEKYPDYRNTKILKLLENFLNISYKNISLGVGSTQILFDIPKILSYERAIIIVPTFWEYTNFNVRFGKKIKKIILSENNNFKPDYILIQKTIRKGDCVFICNVNSPTSVLYKKKGLLEIIDNNPNTQFVVDETYLLFRSDFARLSFIKQAKDRKNVHVVISLSKFFAIPGIRLGIFISNRKVINAYNNEFHIPYSINPFTTVILSHLLKNTNFIIKTRQFYDKEREQLYEIIKRKLSNRFHCVKPDGNFIMGHILTKQTSQEIKNTLKQKGFVIRGGHELVDVKNKWIRFSIKKRTENRKLIEKLDEILIN
jgi:threonine-phosphate decarboxylase